MISLDIDLACVSVGRILDTFWSRIGQKDKPHIEELRHIDKKFLFGQLCVELGAT